MSNENKNDVVKCAVCETEMVPKKQGTALDGGRTMDGSSTWGGLVCPKCHPELVESN